MKKTLGQARGIEEGDAYAELESKIHFCSLF